MARPENILSEIGKLIDSKDSATNNLYNRLFVKQSEIEALLQNINNKLTIKNNENDSSSQRNVLNKLQDIEGQFQYVKNSNLEQKILNKIQDLELEVQSVQNRVSSTNNKKEKFNEEAQQILTELRILMPQISAVSRNDRFQEITAEFASLKKQVDNLNQKLLTKSNQIDNLNQTIQIKSTQIEKLENYIWKIQTEEQQKKISKFNSKDLIQIKVSGAERNYYNHNTIVVKFQVINNAQYKSLNMHIEKDQKLGDLQHFISSFIQDQNNCIRNYTPERVKNMSLNMSMFGQKIVKAVINSTNINEKQYSTKIQLECQGINGEIFLIIMNSHLAMYFILYTGTPVYITTKAAQSYCTK